MDNKSYSHIIPSPRLYPLVNKTALIHLTPDDLIRPAEYGLMQSTLPMLQVVLNVAAFVVWIIVIVYFWKIIYYQVDDSYATSYGSYPPNFNRRRRGASSSSSLPSYIESLWERISTGIKSLEGEEERFQSALICKKHGQGLCKIYQRMRNPHFNYLYRFPFVIMSPIFFLIIFIFLKVICATPTVIPHLPPTPTFPPTFTLNCTHQHPCGLYPNHHNDCSTYFLCTNNSGTPIKHQCHGGQQYDVYSMECRPPEDATCWTEPDSGPFTDLLKKPSFCDFKERNGTLSDANGILMSPRVTNWGTWGQWLDCPKGSFVGGITAWRRLLKQGLRQDHAGLISLGLQCKSPQGSPTSSLIAVAQGAPNDGFSSFYSCAGSTAAIGMRVNTQPPHSGDNIATDNVQLICPCGPPAYKPYESIPGDQSGNRGVWSGEILCKNKGEAICGVRMQMGEYKEYLVSAFDNTGLNNIDMKCCPVDHPVVATCTTTPSELLHPLRTCSNTQGIYPRRCDFPVAIGITYTNNNDPKINFYESLGGFSLQDKETGEKLFEHFANNTAQLKEYDWTVKGPIHLGSLKVPFQTF